MSCFSASTPLATQAKKTADNMHCPQSVSVCFLVFAAPCFLRNDLLPFLFESFSSILKVGILGFSICFCLSFFGLRLRPLILGTWRNPRHAEDPSVDR